MSQSPLLAVSPLDGRYHTKTMSLSPFFSESALIYYRLMVEVKWLESLAHHPDIKELPPFNTSQKVFLEDILEKFDEAEALKVKEYENQTNHDVKAVEYYLRDQLLEYPPLRPYVGFIHFACTSEDINNLAYAFMLKESLTQIIQPTVALVIASITMLAKQCADYPMLSHTHGQPATPTTLGKELVNFAYRLKRPQQQLAEVQITAKFNGAVGNYNAHVVAYPEIDWRKHTQQFVTSLGLAFTPYSTQIEPHDCIAEVAHLLIRLNTILIDFARDIWSYISFQYFKQKAVKDEVGSSTMPHKINPIDYENAEGNLGLANTLLNHFALKLPISRLQRDLSDSTVMRNLGSAIAYALVAYQSLVKGNDKLTVNEAKLNQDLENNWSVLAEAVQSVMRRHKIPDAYEQLKKLTRGQEVTKKSLHEFINSLDLPKEAKADLLNLTPKKYTGLASVLVKAFS
ncbi:MAG: adenylosuccinate lyase [Legionellales bacterium RIFCSPHIGHO2_12_FULL_37_14]|nr:MAG: adenylosuccinate lyase [Legionellales bacterium RIFCSPHIGHO2_12_FULL_37_14]